MPSVENKPCGCDWQAFVYINVFLACSSFSCALPTIEPYLAELGALGYWAYAVAIYSVGQFVASPTWGYLCSVYRSENTLYASLIIGVIGGYMYATASTGVEILIARVLIGLYTGSQEACHRTIVVRCTTDNERTIAQAGVSTATVLGFLFGPAFAGIFFFKPLGPVMVMGVKLRLNSFTGPGWLIVLFCCISSIFVTIGLTQEQTEGLPQCQQKKELSVVDVEENGEQYRVYRSLPHQDPVGAEGGGGTSRRMKKSSKSPKISQKMSKSSSKSDSKAGSVAAERSKTERDPLSAITLDEISDSRMPLRFAGIAVCGLVLFVNALGFSAYETITTPLVENDFGWDLFYADMLFVGAGIVCILVFFIIRVTSASVEDRYLLLCGVVFSTMGYGLMMEFTHNRLPLPRFLLGFAAVNAAMELNRSVTMSLASKVLPPTSQFQGLLQGILISCVACARIIGPMYAVWVWNATDRDRFSQGHWVFVGLFVSFLLTTIVYILWFGSLQPYKVLYMEWKKNEMKQHLVDTSYGKKL